MRVSSAGFSAATDEPDKRVRADKDPGSELCGHQKPLFTALLGSRMAASVLI